MAVRLAQQALVCALSVASTMTAHAAGAAWTTPSGTLQGTRYSTLAQITPDNVAGLTEEFNFPTGVSASHEASPLVVGTTMYVVTPFPNRLYALDLAQGGKLLWSFTPEVDEYARGVACCDVVNRGAAYGDGKIVYNALDDSTVAVNAVTGRQVWRTRLGDPATGETITMAPLIVGTRVFVGNSGAELGIRGWIAALDLKTGKQLWRAYNTGPDADVKIGPSFRPFYAKDRGTDLGVSTWPAEAWRQGGATVWGWLTYDPTLDLLFHGTANPGVWNPDMRPGDNKWGASVFARKPATGEVVWAYQFTPHDGWDFDSINENIVADLPIGGQTRKTLVHFDKNGFAYTFDRNSGELLVAKPFGAVNWASGVDLATGLPSVDPAKVPHQGATTTDICPSPLGVKDWEPASYSPKTKLFYVPAINFCDDLEPLKAQFIAGTPFMGADIAIKPGPGGNMGALVAWDGARGRAAWTVNETLPLYGGTLATAGGVVFYGTLDKWLRAVDAKTGAKLFETRLDCGVVSGPISFTGADGKQRIAVTTGVGWLAGGFAGGACPATRGEWEDVPPPRTPPVGGGVVHVFKLAS
ncbi:MAG: PQQ-dependent dehydrogenase, methanol/ethanol family [Geminicoccaceae bacterium]